MTPKETARAAALSRNLSQQFPSVGQVDIMERLRTAVGAFGDFPHAEEALPSIVRSLVVLSSLRGLDRAAVDCDTSPTASAASASSTAAEKTSSLARARPMVRTKRTVAPAPPIESMRACQSPIFGARRDHPNIAAKGEFKPARDAPAVGDRRLGQRPEAAEHCVDHGEVPATAMNTLLLVLDLLGTFALSGATPGMKRRLDLFGVLVLSFAARNCALLPKPRGFEQISAATPEPALVHTVAGLLAFPEELDIAHDRLLGVVGPPMRDICFVIGNANHQARRSRGPIGRGAGRPRRAIKQVLEVRHDRLP
jgi:hypothetical protein